MVNHYSYFFYKILAKFVKIYLVPIYDIFFPENVSDWIPNSLGSSYFAKYTSTNPIHNIYNNLLKIHHFKNSQYNHDPYEKNTIIKSPPLRKQSNFLSKFFQNVKINELKTALQSVYSTMVKNSVPGRPNNNIRRQFSLLGSPVSTIFLTPTL